MCRLPEDHPKVLERNASPSGWEPRTASCCYPSNKVTPWRRVQCVSGDSSNALARSRKFEAQRHGLPDVRHVDAAHGDRGTESNAGGGGAAHEGRSAAREPPTASGQARTRSDEDLLPSLALQMPEEAPVHVQRALARCCAIDCAVLTFVAHILASAGIQGRLANPVSRWLAEIGFPRALGATSQILRRTLGDGLRPTLFGLAGGTLAAFGVCWVLRLTLRLPGSSEFFHGVPFYDPATLSIVAAVALLVAGAAVAGPAWRALWLDPMEALRRE